MWPSSGAATVLVELHDAVIQGDPAAVAPIWVELWQLLRQRLQWRLASADLVEDAVNDAIRAYLANPQEFDPSRASLDSFVYGIAKRMLRDRVRGERRSRERDGAYASHRHAYESGSTDRATLHVLAREVRSGLLPRVCDRLAETG